MNGIPRGAVCAKCDKPIMSGEHFRDHKTLDLSVHDRCVMGQLFKAVQELEVFERVGLDTSRYSDNYRRYFRGYHLPECAA